jgi:hypothetical protein
MKKTAIIGILALAAAACSNSAQVATQPTPNANNTNTTTAQKNADSLVVSSHSSEKTQGATNPSMPGAAAQKPQTESPMAKAIDVSEMTATIEKAEKDYKAKQADAKAKQTLADAYFERAFALTEAAQYRAALGDFRKGLKLDSNKKDARDMHDRIISIFKSINREPPKEGEEPAPMPFNKD